MESFNVWMDARHMTAEEASELFAKSVGTIRNWRSIGVPDSQVAWVEKRMAEHDAKQIVSLPNRVILEPTREQFRAWGRSALGAGKLIDDWALDALDEAAAADEANPTGSSPAPNPLWSMPTRAALDGIARNAAAVKAKKLADQLGPPSAANPNSKVAEEDTPYKSGQSNGTT